MELIEKIKLYNYVRAKNGEAHLMTFFLKKGLLKPTDVPVKEDIAAFFNEDDILIHSGKVHDTVSEISIDSYWENDDFVIEKVIYKLSDIPLKYGKNVKYYKNWSDENRDKAVELYFQNEDNKSFFSMKNTPMGHETFSFSVLGSSIFSTSDEDFFSFINEEMIDTSKWPLIEET